MLFQIPKLPAELRIVHLNQRVKAQRQRIEQAIDSKDKGSSFLTRLKKQIEKSKAKRKDKNQQKTGNVYVLDFKGDVFVNAVDQLREEITLILSVAKPDQDRVVLRLESPGGAVHGYGLAAAQLVRLRDAGFELIICVDKVAASGGYMMACIANQIISAPFAVVGSIGVVAQLPNFNKLLKKHDIDYEVFTAGEYKRTVTVFGENSDQGKQKFEQELQQTHELFKHFVEKYRPKLNVEQVATGEHWYGEDALKLNLVDELKTSDAYLLDLIEQNDVYLIQTRHKPTLGEKLGLQAASMARVAIPACSEVLSEQMQRLAQKSVLFRDPNV
ncbi:MULTISPECIES: protease SohB [unclassified Acinetobacter]|uniref:protease SohB n=1 Tax=unclassified Acinetobacter TaxID=196816 RepID=UPI0035B861AA